MRHLSLTYEAFGRSKKMEECQSKLENIAMVDISKEASKEKELTAKVRKKLTFLKFDIDVKFFILVVGQIIWKAETRIMAQCLHENRN